MILRNQHQTQVDGLTIGIVLIALAYLISISGIVLFKLGSVP